MNVLTIKNDFNRGRMNIEDIKELIVMVEQLKDENEHLNEFCVDFKNQIQEADKNIGRLESNIAKSANELASVLSERRKAEKLVEQLEEENGLMAEKHAVKDMAIRGAIERIEAVELIKEMYLNSNLALIKEVELYKLQEARLIIQNKKLHEEIKELKRNSRTIRFFEMAEENLRMAQEVERLKRNLGVN